MIRYLITDGLAALDERRWLTKLARWMARGVDVVQIRERSLPVRELAELTRKVVAMPNPHRTRILVNDRADVAMACGADGVHLRDGSVLPSVFAHAGLLVSVACHDLSRIEETAGADYILLAPVFAPLSKDSTSPQLGLDGIRRACGLTSIAILALGGITRANEDACVEAGAAGIAGISYFENPIFDNPTLDYPTSAPE